jgi:hypothetical protein
MPKPLLRKGLAETPGADPQLGHNVALPSLAAVTSEKFPAVIEPSIEGML